MIADLRTRNGVPSRQLIRLSPLRQRAAVVATTLVLWLTALAGSAFSQRPVHYFHRSDLPPGVVGRGQLLRGGPLAGYFQPVEIKAPAGVLISLAEEGQFGPAQNGSMKAGMLIGSVYRLKVGNIPLREGFEVYPTVEVINRLYPPPGQEARFPIPIQLTQEELEMALDGRFVTRVIYLEAPNAALPRREDPQRQRYFEVGQNQDALQVADRLGRPMAILRMGSRVPDRDEATGQFTFGTPPLLRYSPSDSDKASDEDDDAGVERFGRRVPRIPLLDERTYDAHHNGARLLR